MKVIAPRYTETETKALNTYIKLMRAAETVTARTSRIMAKSNLTISQFGVLEALFHKGSLCQRDIAEKMLKSTGNITMVIDNLEKRGLVRRQRDTDDRRYITIHLTDDGNLLIANVFPLIMETIVQEMNILKDPEQEELGRLCRMLGLSERDAPLT
ncbi:MAG: MarR family transcriptional regulator [Chlorobiales bacterium]|nr:MarR family transcriptional regulator [Chlorobiales bacterium]